MQANWDAEIEAAIAVKEVSVVGSIDVAKLKALLKAFFSNIKLQGDAIREEVDQHSKELKAAQELTGKRDQV